VKLRTVKRKKEEKNRKTRRMGEGRGDGVRRE
jgi:hypothetical protein